MKRKDFIIKQLYFSTYDCQWHADEHYTYKVLDVMVLPDNAIGVKLIRKNKKKKERWFYFLYIQVYQ